LQNSTSHPLLAPTQSLIPGQRYIQENVVALSCLYRALLEHEFFTTDYSPSTDLLIIVLEEGVAAIKIWVLSMNSKTSWFTHW